MKRTIASLLFLIALSFAVTTYADVVTYYNDFSVGKVKTDTQASWSINTDLRPWYSNLRYSKSGDSTLHFDLGNGYIVLDNATYGYGTLQMDASKFLSTATAYDLTAGDLVYECYYGNTTKVSAGGSHHGISINDNQMTFIYHPGYQNGNGSIKGAFRIHGDFGEVTTNQNIGFKPPTGSTTNYTMVKLTIHRDADAGVYSFKTEFGQATKTGDGWNTTGYTYNYVHTCPIETVDAAGGIKSIGPYGYHNNDADITNLRLQAPFSAAEFAKAQDHSTSMNTVISADQPVHWYKFDNASTNVIADSGSNPVDGTSRNVDMSAISELHQVADFSGNYSKVDLTGTSNITGNWTAEFYINPHNVTGRQALTSAPYVKQTAGSLRWIMNGPNSDTGKLATPGYTKWGAYDAEFKGPDGVSDFSYDLSQIVDQWIHVTYVRKGNDMFLYIDGELVGADFGRAIDLPISQSIGSNGDSEAFAGMIDDIAFYSSALTADQIWTHAYPESILYYNVNTADMSAENWTVDGTNKKGAWFIKNGESNTETYDKPVILDVDGTFQIGAEKNLTLSDVVSGAGALEKIDAGKLTLSGANTYTGLTTVSGGVLELTGDAIVANGPVSVGADGTLVYNVDGELEPLTIDATNKIFGTGQVIKTGEGTLKLCALYAEADKMIDVQSLTVSSGRVDIKECFYGQLIVQSDATFSPGNSVGSLEIGDGTYGGGFILNEAGAELLMEIGGASAANNDILIVDGDITLGNNAIITLAMTDDCTLGLGESFTAILSAENSSALNVLNYIQTSDFTDLKYVQLEGGAYNGRYAITGRRLNANEIPEPSTWALLILGVAGMLYWRKRK